MDYNKRESENNRDIQLMLVFMLTVFSFILSLRIFRSGWELWVLPLLIIELAVAWKAFFSGIYSFERFNTGIIYLCLINMFFYGIHYEVFEKELPMLFAFFAMTITIMETHRLIVIAVCDYFAVAACHIIMGNITFLGFFEKCYIAIILMLFIIGYSRVHIRKYSESKEMFKTYYSEMLKDRHERENFLANVSHELRTPVNAIIGMTDVLLGTDLKEEAKDKITDVNIAGKRLAGQIDDILNYSEIISGHIETTEAKYNISSVLNDIKTFVSFMNKKENVEVVFDVDPNIPSVLLGDERKIRNIIRGLVENAVKFTEEGGVFVKVGFRREEYGGNLCFDITDTGIGMSEDMIDGIFKGYYQIDGERNRTAGGMGLGLPIVKGLVRAMEGFQSIDSEPGVGTHVNVCIPQKIAEDKPMASLEIKSPVTALAYIRQDKFRSVRLRNFYNECITDMAKGLKVNLLRAYSVDEIKENNRLYNVDFIFIGKLEYEEDPGFFESINGRTKVIMIVPGGYTGRPESKMLVVRKPFSVINFVNIMNGDYELDREGTLYEYVPLVIKTDTKALVVDDDPLNLNVALSIFRGYGMEVETADSGMQALGKCAGTRYDIIFMDHMMPEMDGIETFKRIREDEKGINAETPVIALTANAISGARRMFMEAGFSGFVSKPIEKNSLERALREAIPYRVAEDLPMTQSGTGPAAKKGTVPSVKKGKAPSVEMGTAPETALGTEAISDTASLDLLGVLESGGVDTKSGIKYCAGAEDFYITMLEEFYKQHNEKRTELEASFMDADAEGYRIKVHALKSNARTLGMTELGEMSLSLETACKEGRWDYVRGNHGPLLEMMDNIKELLEKCLDL